MGAYADDFNMIFAGPDIGTVVSTAQDTVSRTVEFGKNLGITFNASKTEVLHFGKDPKPGEELDSLLTEEDILVQQDYRSACDYRCE